MAPWPPARPAEPDLTTVLDEVRHLVALGRYPSAADLLSRTLPLATRRYGEASPIVRGLRKPYAATLMHIGDYAHALPEIRRLAHEFTLECGPYDSVVLQLRADEQLCLRHLGHAS
ncbi:hypothetical protein [Streptomyces sp. PT12]|uniref:hypothetical protein n=1 Tax=Streptomyces sp. PT12 TaxID=1510197 RepID=UPI000DE32DA0|nr:hypothetical protein [Streptomyces sp. PT12]RBM08964.1 hypothetical protein DEH69_23180 [Streptomyces sp. PT12]